ncbi:Ig-like domain-containing protein, partial [Aldersonia kunmingensis]|uniref:Ig-like domain-containing protein n=1 Tax=Aldersonia kunmingensis TaxID=408066 RepID=UPI000A66BCC8
GQSVSLSATVNPAEAGGTIQFFDSMTPIGAPVPVTAGGATLSHTFTAAGPHAVTAVYSGGTGFLASTSNVGVVNVTDPAPTDVATTTTLTAPATATEGTSVTLSAAVAPAQAGGTVQFFDGATAIGAPVSVSAGGASLTHTFTTTGAHSVTAVYSGETGFLGSSSAARVITVSDSETPGGGTPSFGSSN